MTVSARERSGAGRGAQAALRAPAGDPAQVRYGQGRRARGRDDRQQRTRAHFDGRVRATATDYGSLAALISYFLILSVVGQAIQVATAREGVLGRLGVGPALLATMKRWAKTMLVLTLALTVVSILLRNPIADAVGVKHDQWAAAVGIPAGCLWLELSILRGALQGVGNYKAVGFSLIGEQAVRLVTGAVLAAAGLGVTGAYLGTPISFIVMGATASSTCVATRPSTGASRADRGRSAGLARPLDPRQARLGADRGTDRDRRAPEHRHHRRQAPVHDTRTSPARTPPPRSPPRCWSGSRSARASIWCRRSRAAERKVRTRGPCCSRRSRSSACCAIPCLLIFAFGSHQLMQRGVRKSQLHAYELAARTRARVHGDGRDLPRDPVHAGAEANLVPDRARGGRDRRADPAATGARRPGGFAAVVLAVQAAARCWRSGWRCGATTRPLRRRPAPSRPSAPVRSPRTPPTSRASGRHS